MSTRASPLVVARGISVPGSAGFGEKTGGGLVVVAEGPGDHGSRGLEHELADCSGPATLRWHADGTSTARSPVEQASLVHRLSGLRAGEQPSPAAAAGPGEAGLFRQVGAHELGDGCGRWRWWVGASAFSSSGRTLTRVLICSLKTLWHSARWRGSSRLASPWRAVDVLAYPIRTGRSVRIAGATASAGP